MSPRFVRFTSVVDGEPFLVNAAWITHAEVSEDSTDEKPLVALWVGNEYGADGDQMLFDVLGTLDEVERTLNGQVSP